MNQSKNMRLMNFSRFTKFLQDYRAVNHREQLFPASFITLRHSAYDIVYTGAAPGYIDRGQNIYSRA